MGMFSEILQAQQPTEEGPDTVGQSLRKGWDAGIQGSLSQLNSAAGLVGETMGFDGFAKNRYDAAKAQQEEAARVGPQIRESGQVDSLRTGLNYAAGVVGGSAPAFLAAIGAGALTGGAALPALAASTAVMAPLEIGDVIQRQQSDPEAMRASAGDRLRDAVIGGGASALAQGVVPAAVGGKLVGRGASRAAERSFMGNVAHNVVGGAAMEGVAEGGGDAIKQFAANQGKPLDWGSIRENAIGGMVGGGAMGGVGLAADTLVSAPVKTWIGAKGMAQDGLQAGKNTLAGAQEAVDPVWAQIKPSVDAGVAAMRSGAANAWEAMPESVKGAGEFLKTSFEDQTADAVAALKRIKEADDIPDAIKQQALESGKSLGLAANRAYVWSVDQTRDAMGMAKAAVPQSISDRLRGLTTPKDDTIDRVAAGTPLGDEDFTNATPDMLQRSDSKAAEWAKTKGAELLNRTSLSDEKKAQLTQALSDVTDQTNRAVVAGIAKSTQAFDALSKRVDAAYEGIKAGIAESRAKGGTKKSEDYSGFERQVVERAAPILQETHPELFEAEGAKLLKRIGATLSMFMRSAADGQMVRLKTLNGVVEDMLGKEPAERVLDSLYGLIEGNEQQVNNFYKVRAEMDAEAKTREPLEAILTKFSTNEAAERSGINSDPKEWASFLRDWAHGRLTEGMPSAKAAFEDERVRTAVTKHFGTKSKNILAALDREMEQVRKDSGVGKNQFDSDEIIEDAGDKDSEEKDVDSRYFDAKGESSDAPQLYDHPDLAKGKAGFKSATQQALNRFRVANPDSRVYFVPLRDYAKAHNLSEAEMLVIADGKNPSEVGYVKAERIKDDDSLRQNEIRRMRMEGKYVQTKAQKIAGSKDVNPDAIKIPGTERDYYDSKRIANVMHSRDVENWTEAEGSTGWAGRMAHKFAEGIAALSVLHGVEIKVRDDQVIATIGERDLTWGDAKKIMREVDTVSSKGTDADRASDLLRRKAERDYEKAMTAVPKEDRPNVRLQTDKDTGTGVPDLFSSTSSPALRNAQRHAEADLRDSVADLSDRELGSMINKLTEGRDAILEPLEAQIKAEVAEELGKARFGSNKSNQIYREVRKRIKDARKNESTNLPLFDRIIQSLEYEQDKRSGEDRRSTVMDVGNESRQGLAVGKAAQRAAEGKQYSAESRADTPTARVRAQSAQLDAASKSRGVGRIGEAPGIGSGRTEGDPEGNIHDSAATMSAKDLERNTQELRVQFPNTKEVLSRAALIMESESPIRKKLYDRVAKLVTNSAVMSGRDLDALIESARRDSIVDFNSVVNDTARKYADRIVAPGVKAEDFPSKRGPIQKNPVRFDSKGRALTDNRAVDVNSADDDYSRVAPTARKVGVADKGSKLGANPARSNAVGSTGDANSQVIDAISRALNIGGLGVDRSGAEPLGGKFTDAIQDVIDKLRNEPNENQTLDGSAESVNNVETALHDEAQQKLAKLVDSVVNTEKWPETIKGMERFLVAAKQRYEHLKATYNDDTSKEDAVTFYKLKDMFSPTADLFMNFTETDGFDALSEKEQERLYDLAESLTKEGTPDPKPVAAKKAAFLERAVSGDKDLIKELSTSNDAKGLQRAVEALYDVQGADAVLQAANSRLGELMQNPDVAYGLQTKKYSLDATRATGTPLTAKGREQIKAYLRSTTPWASVAFPNMPHAGEFTMEQGEAIVRVSAHALNPTSVAYHESLHAFFQHLNDGKMADVMKTVMQTASKPAVTARLRELLAHSPEAQGQLSDAEERAAYMYQFWAQGDEKLIAAMGEKPTSSFSKLADYFRKLLGVWSNDERALHILDYFSSGEYGANVGKPNAAYEAMMETGRNAALDKLGDMAHGFMEMGEAVWGAGSANLRDSGIPALGKLADMVKRKSTGEGTDAGYLPAARIARAEYLDKLANTIGSMDEAVAHEALEALQTGTTAKGADAERVRAAVRKTLDDMYGYLTKAGVRVNDMGLGKDYFPRRWDATYLSKNKQKFLDMARNYPEWHNPEATFNRLISTDGSEIPVVERPGMASKQERLLSFISAEDAAPFMSKNLYQIMNSYVSQATRRAEWARRFTDTNKVLENLLDQAAKQGATSKQIAEAKRFVQGVNGTLGDNINPNLRRYMGNMMVYQNLRLLPLAVFSSAVDPLGITVRGGTVGQAWKTFMRAIREVPAGLKGQEIKDHWTDVAETLGVIESATLNNALGSLYLQGAVGDTARRINDKFFRFNLMEQFNRSMHVGATEAAVKFLMKHKDLKGPHSARYLAELGLKPSDIQIAGGRVKLTTAEGLTEAQAAKIKSAVNMWVDGAILRPDAADKPVWMNDPKYMLVAHLKQFVYAFQHTILARTVHEFKHGNAGPALALTSYVPFMLIADGMKDFLVNAGDEPEWKKAWGPGQYLANSVERAGLLGVGQFGVDTLTGRAGTLTGPTIEQLGEAVQVGGGNKQFKSMFIHSMPANAVYAPMLKAGRDEHFHPDE